MSEKLLKLFENDLDNFKSVLLNSETLAEVCSAYGYSNHGRNTNKVTHMINKYSLDSSHLRTCGSYPAPLEIKVCPQCNLEFTSKLGSKDATCCSHACANKYFAYKQGTKNRTTGIGIYRDILIREYVARNFKFKCCVCEEDNPIIIDIHHLDEDRHNNEFDNLVPLCVLHHRTWHLTKDSIIFNAIIEELDRR